MKTFLVAVCGLSPQVITETLYALHRQGMKVDAIRILTTRRGKDACIGQLLRADDGEYFRYLAEYNYEPKSIDFSPRHVMAVLNEDGSEIDDIDTEEENERFLQLCMEEAFRLTNDSEQRVYFSIAGGRRTMGACLSLAAQCYARQQDRIYHVLLSPSEFDSSRDFFYPPSEPRMIEVRNRDGHSCWMETSLAQITLVPLPFFPLRGHLTQQMLKNPESPATLMLSLVRETRHDLTIDLLQRKLIWKGVELDLSPSRMAVYALLALLKKEAVCRKVNCQECVACYVTFEQLSRQQKELTRLYQRMTTRETGKAGIVNLELCEFNSYRSKINKEILFTFGDIDGKKLQIESLEKPTINKKFGIRLDKERIRIVS